MKKIVFVFFHCLVASFLFAQSGSNDLTFNSTDNCTFGDGPDGSVNTSVLQSDDKIIIGGDFSKYNGVTKSCIARLNSDGSLDQTFLGFGFSGGALPSVRSLAIQPDGKIIAAGSFTNYSGTVVNNIVRLNTDGTLDNSFNVGTGPVGEVTKIALQSDGSIVAVGFFTSFNGTPVNRVVRITSAGALDATFTTNIGTGFNSYPTCLALQSDGKIVVGGNFIQFNGNTTSRIVRLNSDGTYDPTFAQQSTTFDGLVTALAIQSDGKIIAGGDFNQYGTSSPIAPRIVRINTNGTRDLGFDAQLGFNNGIKNITINAAGKIVVSGLFTTYNGTAAQRLVQLNSNGSIDFATFTQTNFNSAVYGTTIQPDGKIICVGQYTQVAGKPRVNITRLNSTGLVDPTFNPGAAMNNPVAEVVRQPDGKMIAIGSFTSYFGERTGGIVRINTDGTIDNTFNAGGVGFDLTSGGQVRAIALQADGKILVGGNFPSYNGTANPWIIRLNSDGTKDASFNAAPFSSLGIYDIQIQADGKILVGGDFGNYGSSGSRLVRLNSDGTIDNSFFTGTIGFNNGTIVSMAIQADGKIIVNGSFNSFNGQSQPGTLRLNTDGLLDNGFNVGTAGGSSSYKPNMVIQPDGKIIIVGSFSNWNGNTANKYIVRLNSDGSTDPTFSTTSNNAIYAVTLKSDGKIVIGGLFSTVNDETRWRIAGLNSDGSIDLNFVVPTNGFNNTVNDLLTLPNDQIIAVGAFTRYGTDCRHRIARLQACPTITVNTINTNATCFGAQNGSIDLSVSGGNAPYTYNWGSGINTEDRSALAAGTYNVTITDNTGCTASSSVTISQPTQVTGTVNTTSILCFGDSTGAIDLTPSGGSAPYSFDWSNGDISEDLTDIPAGDYHALIYDGSGCISDTIFVTVTENAPLAVNAIVTNVMCNGASDGSINLTTTGGNGFYGYNWDNGSYSEDLSGLSAGTYTVTVAAGGGCSVVDTIVVTEPNAIVNLQQITICYNDTLTVGSNQYTVSGTYSNVYSAFNGCDSTVTIDLTVLNQSMSTQDQVAYLNYTWNGVNYLTSGTYQFTTTNTFGCDSTATLNLVITAVPGDLNGDGVISTPEIAGDTSMDGTIGSGEIAGDSNGNGIIDGNETTGDANGDGTIGSGEVSGDSNGNGIIDGNETTGDTNGDGTIGSGEVSGDSNGNGIIDGNETTGDTNGDGSIGSGEVSGDSNGNGVIDVPGEIAGDTNGDGVISNPEIIGDSNGNGVIDNGELEGDTNGNGVADPGETVGLLDSSYLQLSISPNPTLSFVSVVFNAPYATITVKDVNGKNLQSTTVLSGEKVELGSYQAGVYFVEVNTSFGTKIERIVKQ